MSKILVALDVSLMDEALRLVGELEAHVDGFKVGLELLTSEGPDAVEKVAAFGKPVFVDAKLHDIPNTVERAASNLAAAGARWVTVHAIGGTEMMRAAVTGMGRDAPSTGVLAVSVLTSMTDGDLGLVGIDSSVASQVRRLTRMAETAGAEGVVCAPSESVIVKETSPQLLAVTPGIRLSGTDSHDQRRVSTPEEAAASGADYLVIGRAITGSEDPAATAQSISQGLRLPPSWPRNGGSCG